MQLLARSTFGHILAPKVGSSVQRQTDHRPRFSPWANLARSWRGHAGTYAPYSEADKAEHDTVLALLRKEGSLG